MALKKLKDIKSGQRVYRVWGYHLRPENIEADGQPYSIRVEACLPLGKRKHYSGSSYGRSYHILNGTLCNRYFRKKAKAEQYIQEVLDGKHIDALIEMEEHERHCDMLEKAMFTFGLDHDDYIDYRFEESFA